MGKFFRIFIVCMINLLACTSCGGDDEDMTIQPYEGWKMACHSYIIKEYSDDGVTLVDYVVYNKGLIKACYTYSGKAFGGYTSTVFLVCHYNTSSSTWEITGFHSEDESKADALVNKYR